MANIPNHLFRGNWLVSSLNLLERVSLALRVFASLSVVLSMSMASRKENSELVSTQAQFAAWLFRQSKQGLPPTAPPEISRVVVFNCGVGIGCGGKRKRF